jgi:hypothetical protein
MRRQIRAEAETDRPLVINSPVTWQGVAIDLPDQYSTSGLHWTGAGEERVSIASRRVEVAWRTERPARNRIIDLVAANGRVVARIEFAADEAPELKAVPGAKGWFWVGVAAPAPRDSTGVRLQWRLLPVAPLPADWPSSDRWPEGSGWRLEMPLVHGAAPAVHQLALVDPISGWALTTVVSVR